MGGGLPCSSCRNAFPPVGLLFILYQPLLAVSRDSRCHRKGQDAIRGIVDPVAAVEKAVLAGQMRQNVAYRNTPPIGDFLWAYHIQLLRLPRTTPPSGNCQG